MAAEQEILQAVRALRPLRRSIDDFVQFEQEAKEALSSLYEKYRSGQSSFEKVRKWQQHRWLKGSWSCGSKQFTDDWAHVVEHVIRGLFTSLETCQKKFLRWSWKQSGKQGLDMVCLSKAHQLQTQSLTPTKIDFWGILHGSLRWIEVQSPVSFLKRLKSQEKAMWNLLWVQKSRWYCHILKGNVVSPWNVTIHSPTNLGMSSRANLWSTNRKQGSHGHEKSWNLKMHFQAWKSQGICGKRPWSWKSLYIFNFFHELWFLVNKVLIEFEKMQALKINYTMNLHYIKKWKCFTQNSGTLHCLSVFRCN